MNRFISKTPLSNVTHSSEEGTFATAGQII
jgi:hypothetical protein